MHDFFENSLFAGVTLSLISYLIGSILKKKFKLGIFNPLLISIVVTILVLVVSRVDYDTYNEGAQYLSWLLTPATVCLAIPLYEQWELLKHNCKAVMAGLVAGVVTSLCTVFVLSKIMGLTHEDYVTMLPKCITTAIGMSVSEELGGYVTITVAVIIVTGVLGNIFGELVCKIFRITEPISKGLAFGSASHAIGTAKAIEIGEVEFFKGMIEEAGLDDETEQRIKEYIHSKNFFGLTEFVNTLEIPEERKTALKSFESLFGGLDMLDHAEKLVTNAASLEAIARMRKVYTALTSYGYEKYVSFDLSMINRFNYYTGIVFRGYTYGTGDAIVKGGRYNSLMEKFGKKAPSVGFAIYVDDLMSAIARNKIDVALDYSNVLVLYKEEDQKEAIAYACKLRAEDQKVELVRMSRRHDLQEYIDYAHKMHFAKLCYFEAADKITEY